MRSIDELKAFIKEQESDYKRAKATLERLSSVAQEFELAKAVVAAYEASEATPLRQARYELSQLLLKRELGA